ncbi:MAG: ATP-binding cassette domain-containing protein, partial [Halanaerobiaceae bacterium]
TLLFSGSIRENICYGNSEATEEEIIKAAKIAQAHQFIEELSEGYDTKIEQRGVNLSGGQKQRIAIARALITRPSILIFDDSTSAVDIKTEYQIMQSLKQSSKETTVLIIAQKISSVMNADEILLLEDGKIVSSGTHEELMEKSQTYQDIYRSQFGKEEKYA